MCVIIDTNTFSRFRNPADEDLEPVRQWLRNRNGKIVYSNIGKYKQEWEKGGMGPLTRELIRRGQLKDVSKDAEVAEKERELKGEIKSDDAHIIALAIVAEVRVLVSYAEGDKALFDDFKDKKFVGGKIYTRRSHDHLLKSDLCL